MSSNSPGTRWIGHPLLGAFAANRQLTVYVRFKMWDTVDKKFEYLPPGIDVSLVDGSPLFSNQTLATVQTDAAGIANFNIVNLTPQFPDMCFVVNTAQITLPFAHHPALPPEWSTKGWRSSNGLEFGYKEQFSGTTFGTSASPIEFEIGVFFFLNIRVESTSEPGAGGYMNLLPHTVVTLNADTFLSSITLTEKVDDLGIARFYSFFIEPESDITLELEARNDSTGSGFPFLQNVFVDDWLGVTSSALTFSVGTAQTRLAANDRTAIGKDNGNLLDAHAIKLTEMNNGELCAAFTSLKNLAELNCLLHYAVGSPDWNDYSGQHINIGFVASVGMSWPTNVINLPPSYYKRRDDQIHEFSHQLLWKWGNYLSLGIFSEYCPILGDATGDHFWDRLVNPEHALLEGWATIFELLASKNKVEVSKDALGGKLTVYPYYSLPHFSLPIKDINKVVIPSSELTTNWGESVEGVFAAAMFNLFCQYVLLPPWTRPASGPIIPATATGDITQLAHFGWLKASGQDALGVRKRFKDIFVEPAKALSNLNNPTTSDFIDAIRGLNPADWDTIRPILQNHFLAFPQIEDVEPAVISSAGGLIDIIGRHFIPDPSTKLYVDAELVPSTIQSSRKITCLAPARAAGSIVSVMLQSPDGDDILVDGLKYV